jgi:hypothetical protein
VVAESGILDFVSDTIGEASMSEMVGAVSLIANVMFAGESRERRAATTSTMIDFLIAMLEEAEGQLACAILEGFAHALADDAEDAGADLRDALGQPEVAARMIELAAIAPDVDHAVEALSGLLLPH